MTAIVDPAKNDSSTPCLTTLDLSLPGHSLPLPPSLPLVISSQDRWDPDTCRVEAGPEYTGQETHRLQLVPLSLQLLETIKKPVAVLSICGPYRSGKSYFLSRLLGRPGAFQLGHSMQACTRGIWMATSVLECEEYAIVLLDTEGIDAVGASETTAMSLLTLATLLSSFLIYNSKKIPQQVDMDKMRCLSQLSSSLLTQRGQSTKGEAVKKLFPHFLWLLRDVTLQITDKSDRIISANEYLHTRMLATESGELTELGQCLHSLFPSLECQALPMPSANPKITKNMFENQEKLKPKFNEGVEGVIRRILQQISPKLAINGMSVVDGPTLVALAQGCLEAINTPGAVKGLEQGWQAIIKWELHKLAHKFVEEYRREMEESLRDNLPMEERNLKRIHAQTMRRKMQLLEEDVRRLNPLSTTSTDRDPILGQLEQTICQSSEGGKVIGGVLFQFTTRNYARSKEQCEEILREIFERSEIHKKCTEAFINSEPLDATGLLKEVQSEYRQRAVGPAAITVLENGSKSISELVGMLKMIPGPPRAIRLIGLGPDRVKLSWEPPLQNPGAVEEYEVWSKKEGKEWKKVRETKKTKILITGLKSDREYQFRVTATNT